MDSNDIGILITSSNGDKTIKKSVTIRSGPSMRIKNLNPPIQQVQMIISQVIICTIDFDWLHFDSEPRMQ